jgi:hypothetical protein
MHPRLREREGERVDRRERVGRVLAHREHGDRRRDSRRRAGAGDEDELAGDADVGELRREIVSQDLRAPSATPSLLLSASRTSWPLAAP